MTMGLSFPFSLPCILTYFFSLAASQFPPPREDFRLVRSRFHENVSISYKEPGICETTPGVRSFSGYVHLPPSALSGGATAQDYPINTFFWFFEARKDPHHAPLAIWLNGGPGASSLAGALMENGPCFIDTDSNSTYLNKWSWNNEVNMLYIDQPNNVGFSYDSLRNITLNLMNPNLQDPNGAQLGDFNNGVPEQNSTFLVGTFSSASANHTAMSSEDCAIALWHFAQTWFAEFPEYAPENNHISLWAESYGGFYGPAISKHFQSQNDKIKSGKLRGPGTMYLYLDMLGIVNGCMELRNLCDSDFISNNTYGIQIQNTSDVANFGVYDITHPLQDPFPGVYMLGFLNQNWVQRALGVPRNFSEFYNLGQLGFHDPSHGPDVRLQELAYVLDKGIRVALVYGDRDVRCDWITGEKVSLHIPHHRQNVFKEAGYAPINTNPFYPGGMVRQSGNLSFSRVYQAGHMVPAYQPETAYRIFQRAMFNRDIATGKTEVGDDTQTDGPVSTWGRLNDVLEAPEPICYTHSIWKTCMPEQIEWLQDGKAVVKDWVVIGKTDD